jgi:CBS domain-containing protein
MKIRDLMNPTPWTVREEDPLRVAHSIMAWGRVGHLPVLRQGLLTGLLSERDILACRASAAAGENWRDAQVRTAMQSPAQTAHPDDSLSDAASRLSAHAIDALPVVERGALVGLITVSDVLAAEVCVAPRPRATAGHVMTLPITARPDESLLDAGSRMVAHGVRILPVVDGRGVLAGVVSERALRAVLGEPVLESLERGVGAQLRVRDLMNRTTITVAEEYPLSELADFFADHRVAALPVVARDGSLRGMVSYADVLRAMAN